jgi:hypothetical protein
VELGPWLRMHQGFWWPHAKPLSFSKTNRDNICIDKESIVFIVFIVFKT